MVADGPPDRVFGSDGCAQALFSPRDQRSDSAYCGDEGRAHHYRGQQGFGRSEEHTSELQSQSNLVCRLLLEKKKATTLSSEPCAQTCLASFLARSGRA